MPINTPDLKAIRRVKTLRKKGLSYRAIARKMEKSVKSVWRWDQYRLK